MTLPRRWQAALKRTEESAPVPKRPSEDPLSCWNHSEVEGTEAAGAGGRRQGRKRNGGSGGDGAERDGDTQTVDQRGRIHPEAEVQ